MTTTTKERGRIASGGMGGFLNPPTHPEHTLHIETDLRRRPENRGGLSLSSAAESEWLDADTRRVAKHYLGKWSAPELASPEIVQWIHQVLGYFRGCYRGADPNPWNADRLVIVARRVPMPPLAVTVHAGVHWIRQFYPEYIPSAGDFARARWGTQPFA